MAKETLKEIKAAGAVESSGEAAGEHKGGTEAAGKLALEGKRTDGKESVYSADELAANAKKIFGTRQECVTAALRAAGKSRCTVSEAKEIVEKFLKREVK